MSKWAKVRKPDEKYQNYTIDLYMTPASWKEFKASGLSMTPKRSDEGEFVTFRRPESKLIKNEVVTFGPPSVLNPDETEFEGLVGNGSEVTIKVVVYDTMKGKGHRLEAIRVDKLVPYEGNGEGPRTVFPVAPKAPPAAKVAAPAGNPPF